MRPSCVRRLAALLPLACYASAAAAQGGAAAASPPVIDFATDAETHALIARAKAALAPGQATGAPLPLVRVPGYRAVVEYRAAPTPPMSHDRDAEFMYVVEGSGTMILGGTLADPQRRNEANVAGSAIVGGTPHPLAAGSFVFVPRGVPHHFAQIGPAGLAVVMLHVPAAP